MHIQRSTSEASRGIGAGGDCPLIEIGLEGREALKDDALNERLACDKVLLRLYTSDKYAPLLARENSLAMLISSVVGAIQFNGQASAAWIACHCRSRRTLHALVWRAMYGRTGEERAAAGSFGYADGDLCIHNE